MKTNQRAACEGSLPALVALVLCYLQSRHTDEGVILSVYLMEMRPLSPNKQRRCETSGQLPRKLMGPCATHKGADIIACYGRKNSALICWDQHGHSMFLRSAQT